MSKYLILVLVLVAGLLQPVQVAMNTKLEKTAHSPLLPVMITFGCGALLAALIWSSGIAGRGEPALLGQAPWWAWFTGPVGIVVLMMPLIALPRSGAALVVAAMVLGQATSSLILDHYGWLDVKKIPISAWRVGGVAMILGGVLLMQKR